MRFAAADGRRAGPAQRSAPRRRCTTVDLCAKKCRLTNGCLAFEVYEAPLVLACYLFLNQLKAPF